MIIGVYNPSVILTYLGVGEAILGMNCCIIQNNIKLGMICLIFSGICDLFDGVIARRCKRTEDEKAFGVQIDSLADMISFIALPVVLGISLMKQTGFIALIILLIYSIAGITRLAWYNVHNNHENKIIYFEGLPVTYTALILPCVYLLRGFLDGIIFIWMIAIVYIIIAVFYVAKVRIKKPSGIWYIFFGLLAIVLTLLLIFIGVS